MLFAVLVSVNLTSCNSDDENDSVGEDSQTEKPVREKKLVRVVSYDVEDSREKLDDILEFIYDTKGNVVEILEKYDDGDSYSCKYVWDSNKSITCTWDDEYVKYSLHNGKISNVEECFYSWHTGQPKLDEDFYRLTYDKDGNLMEYWAKYNEEDEYELEERLTWDNGRLSFYEDYNSLITLRYSDKTCKGFFPLLYEYVNCDDYLFMAQPELVGIKMSYLPSKIIDGNCTISFECELDTEGYVGSCAVNKYYSYDHDYNGDGRDDYNSYDYLYEFVWE